MTSTGRKHHYRFGREAGVRCSAGRGPVSGHSCRSLHLLNLHRAREVLPEEGRFPAIRRPPCGSRSLPPADLAIHPKFLAPRAILPAFPDDAGHDQVIRGPALDTEGAAVITIYRFCGFCGQRSARPWQLFAPPRLVRASRLSLVPVRLRAPFLAFRARVAFWLLRRPPACWQPLRLVPPCGQLALPILPHQASGPLSFSRVPFSWHEQPQPLGPEIRVP